MHDRIQDDQHEMRIRRVLVLGAGLAGLSAARALSRLGYEVVVLEARDRLGGRCWTVDKVELGAQWIHSTEGNPISLLARELNLSTVFVGGDSTYLGSWEQLLLLERGGHTLDADAKQRSILAADSVRDALDALRRGTIDDDVPDRSMRAAIRASVGRDGPHRSRATSRRVAPDLAGARRLCGRRRRPVVFVVGRRLRGLWLRRQRPGRRLRRHCRCVGDGPRRAPRSRCRVRPLRPRRASASRRPTEHSRPTPQSSPCRWAC